MFLASSRTLCSCAHCGMESVHDGILHPSLNQCLKARLLFIIQTIFHDGKNALVGYEQEAVWRLTPNPDTGNSQWFSIRSCVWSFHHEDCTFSWHETMFVGWAYPTNVLFDFGNKSSDPAASTSIYLSMCTHQPGTYHDAMCAIWERRVNIPRRLWKRTCACLLVPHHYADSLPCSPIASTT